MIIEFLTSCEFLSVFLGVSLGVCWPLILFYLAFKERGEK